MDSSKSAGRSPPSGGRPITPPVQDLIGENGDPINRLALFSKRRCRETGLETLPVAVCEDQRVVLDQVGTVAHPWRVKESQVRVELIDDASVDKRALQRELERRLLIPLVYPGEPRSRTSACGDVHTRFPEVGRVHVEPDKLSVRGPLLPYHADLHAFDSIPTHGALVRGIAPIRYEAEPIQSRARHAILDP